MRLIDSVNDLVVKGLGGDDSRFLQPILQQPLLKRRDKAPKYVPRAEVQPSNGLFFVRI